MGLTEFWRHLCKHARARGQCSSCKIPSALLSFFFIQCFPPSSSWFQLIKSSLCAIAMWRWRIHQVSYTIKRKPLSALSTVLRKLRHHTASIHKIRHQYEKVRTNTISNVYNSKQGDKGTRSLCRLKLVQEDKSSSYASSMFLKHEATWSWFLFTWQNALQGDVRGVHNNWVPDVI